jgi:hypothetical protein
VTIGFRTNNGSVDITIESTHRKGGQKVSTLYVSRSRGSPHREHWDRLSFICQLSTGFHIRLVDRLVIIALSNEYRLSLSHFASSC